MIKTIYFYDDINMLYDLNDYKRKNKIHNIKIKKYNFEYCLRWYMILITSFWLYDEIILENIEINYYFFMLIQRLKKTKITYETMK